MAFRVEVAPQAFQDLDQIANYIKARGSFEISERWFNGIIGAIHSLSENPERCPKATESGLLGTELRLLLFGGRNRVYKIYFAIHQRTKTVRVFHVRHWARRAPDPLELDEWTKDTNPDS
jgi:plasmid stabilization system protein ParE